MYSVYIDDHSKISRGLGPPKPPSGLQKTLSPIKITKEKILFSQENSTALLSM